MSTQNESRSEAIVLKEFISKVISYKYFYLASFVLCILAAFILNKLSPTIYEVNSTIGPVKDRRSGLLGSDELFSGMGTFTQSRSTEDDINSVNSFSLIGSTLEKLNLEVGYYYQKNNIFAQTKQVYLNAPFLVTIDKSHFQPIYAKFYITLLDINSFRLTASEDNVSLYNYVDNKIVKESVSIKIDTICRFNETISNANLKFSVSMNNESLPALKNEVTHFFEFYHLDFLTRQYLENISVGPISPRSSLIDIRFQGKNLDLTVAFINSYLQTFLDDNLSKKNKIAENTIKFIDNQLSEISDSLVTSESQLRDYRSSNQVTDLSYQGQQALEQMTRIETDRSTLQVQERYYNYILDYLEKNQDMAGLAPPSSANVIDPIMNTLVLDFLETNAQRSAILSNNAEKNLFLGQIENKIKLQRQAIVENVKNNLNTLNITQNELNYRAEKLSREISRLPRTELNMVSMQRRFNLTDAIYTFLLEKRSEAAISMAANYPDYEIKEPAREITSTIISPKIMINWFLAIFFSLLIPTLYIILKGFFNNRSGKRDRQGFGTAVFTGRLQYCNCRY